MFIKNIQDEINEFVLSSPENFIEEPKRLSTTPTAASRLQLFDLPLVGVADAADTLWTQLKDPKAVGAHHMSPDEWLQDAKTVISYFLPFTERVRKANRIKEVTASEWLYGRWEGEMFNQALLRFIVKVVKEGGGRVVAPVLDKRFKVVERRSNWSERHAAFVAGLGTFSLSRSMITKAGCAGRFGSVIADLDFEPTRRDYTVFDEYCTKCGVCAKRCPPHAIDENGKDNAICAAYLETQKQTYNPRYGCGKCQAGVICENRIPLR